MSDREVPVYLEVCPDCDNAVGTTVDNGSMPKEVAKFCATAIRAGLRIERSTVGAVRDGALKFHADNCPRNKRKRRVTP